MPRTIGASKLEKEASTHHPGETQHKSAAWGTHGFVMPSKQYPLVAFLPRGTITAVAICTFLKNVTSIGYGFNNKYLLLNAPSGVVETIYRLSVVRVARQT